MKRGIIILQSPLVLMSRVFSSMHSALIYSISPLIILFLLVKCWSLSCISVSLEQKAIIRSRSALWSQLNILECANLKLLAWWLFIINKELSTVSLNSHLKLWRTSLIDDRSINTLMSATDKLVIFNASCHLYELNWINRLPIYVFKLSTFCTFYHKSALIWEFDSVYASLFDCSRGP